MILLCLTRTSLTPLPGVCRVAFHYKTVCFPYSIVKATAWRENDMEYVRNTEFGYCVYKRKTYGL